MTVDIYLNSYMKLLLIENTHEILDIIKTDLKDRFVIDTAERIDDGEYFVEQYEYDIIIIGLDLQDKSELEMCKSLRRKNIHTPVLILSSFQDIKNKVSAIDAGADGFLSKPIHSLELQAYIKALTRRIPTKQLNQFITAGELILDTTNKVVRRKDITIQLRRKEFDLLEYFMRNPGRVMTRDMILNNVWAHTDEFFTNTIDVHVKYLRDRIDRPFNKKLIKTIHGFGYKLET
jgi:DNA-binding response OmpR family regulator